MTSNNIAEFAKPKSLEDRIRAGFEDRIREAFLALEHADELFAERLVALANDVAELRRRYPSNAEFGRAWEAADFRYHGRSLNKNERCKLRDIHLYAIAHPDKVVRDIAESHSRSIERIGQKLALPPPPQPLPPGWQFDDADGRYCFTLTGFRREISIVVVRDGDGSREWWHWGFDGLGDDDESDKPIEEGEADDRQAAMRDAEAAARRVMDADASSEGSEDETDVAPQPQPTPQERAAGLGAGNAPIGHTADLERMLERDADPDAAPTQHVGNYSARPSPDQSVTAVKIPTGVTAPFDAHEQTAQKLDARVIALRALMTLANPDLRVADLIGAAKEIDTDPLSLSRVAATARDNCNALVTECRRQAGLPFWSAPAIKDITDTITPEARSELEREADAGH
jgi:hypothetical protein